MNTYRKLAEIMVVVGFSLIMQTGCTDEPSVVPILVLPTPAMTLQLPEAEEVEQVKEAAALAIPMAVAPIAGEVYSVQLRSTLYGIRQACQGAAGTRVMTKDGAYLFIWSIQDGWAFAGIHARAAVTGLQDVAKANYVNVTTMGELTTWLEENGWNKIKNGDLPDKIVKIIMASKSSWFIDLVRTMPTLIIMMPGAPMPAEILEQVEG
jgi:hypothetical protein